MPRGRSDKRRAKKDKPFLKVCVISDFHSCYLDDEAFSIFLQAYADTDFDQLVILGDLLDAQRISSHPQRFEIMNPVKPRVMDFHEEVEFTVENILRPIRKANSDNIITFIPGNHERRAIRALKGGGAAMEQLYEASARTRRSVHLDDLLCFDELGIGMEYGEDNYGVHYLRHKGGTVAMLHGFKTNVGRLKYYLDYFQTNVLSGHTHQAGYLARKTRHGEIVAAETMCLRTTRGVEFLDEGHDPGWTNGFVSVWMQDTGQVHIRQHKIDRGQLIYQGKLYTAK